jgi:NAD(P)-dependent dehydrogenase (short-subunit alcohol dehydrogenase family)
MTTERTPAEAPRPEAPAQPAGDAGRVALVTGGASGLGAATADVLASAGMCVAVTDVARDGAERRAAEICRAGGSAIGLGLDVRSAAQAARAIDDAVRAFGRLDVLVNNAGADVTAAFGDIAPDAFDRVIDVNLRGPIVMTRAALPHLAASRGHVVNIASTAALRGWPNASAYHASKWGLRGLGQGLFSELRDLGIRVTTVFAGGMRTPFILERFPDVPLEVLQDPANVALAIRFVLDLPPDTVVPEITILPTRETSWP